MRTNPLYISGGSYGGIYAPRLAYAIHTHNQELQLSLSEQKINLQGFIIANGAIDYDHDPHVSSLDMLLHYSIIPYALHQQYNQRQCRVQWIWFYYEYMKKGPHPRCQDMFVKALEMVDYDIYDLRVLKKEPPEEEGSFYKSFKEGVRKDKYRLYGKTMVNG